MQKYKFPALLTERLLALPNLSIAFSGGLDSRFLAYTAKCIGLKPLCVHIMGPHVPAKESQEAELWAKEQGLSFKAIYSDPLILPAVLAGAKDRCYYCKKSLMSAVLKAAKEYWDYQDHWKQEEPNPQYFVADGSNASDLLEYRPGQKALKELGVISPLAEAGLTKAELRELAKLNGMSKPEQKARPCLLTRFAYGLEPSLEQLNFIEALESKIETFFSLIFANDLAQMPDFRLRLQNETSYILQLGIDENDSLAWNNALKELLRQSNLQLSLGTNCQINLPEGLQSIIIKFETQISGHFDRPANSAKQTSASKIIPP